MDFFFKSPLSYRKSLLCSPRGDCERKKSLLQKHARQGKWGGDCRWLCSLGSYFPTFTQSMGSIYGINRNLWVFSLCDKRGLGLTEINQIKLGNVVYQAKLGQLQQSTRKHTRLIFLLLFVCICVIIILLINH